jgi:IS5 family transposase
MYRPIDVYSVQVVHLKRNIHAKSQKHTSKKIRNALRKQLTYVKRDLQYLEQFMSEGYATKGKDINLYLTIIRLYEWQQYILHSYRNRICAK